MRAPSVGMMGHDSVIVGVAADRSEHVDAIALGASLARATESRLVLVIVYESHHGDWHRPNVAYEHALRNAADRLAARLEGLDVEELALPGASAARVLHRLADERTARAIVVASSPRASWGHVELGHVSERLFHGGGVPTAIAPRGYAAQDRALRVIGVGFVGTPEGGDALCAAADLCTRIGATLRVITAFDPAEYVHVVKHAHTQDDLRIHVRGQLDDALATLPAELSASVELLDGDPSEQLTVASLELDLLVVGSRSYGPLRAVLLGGVSGHLAHRAGCPLMVVPHVAAPEAEVTLVGGLEAASSA